MPCLPGSIPGSHATGQAAIPSQSADFWLGLQQDWDLWHALRSDEAAEIAKLKPLSA